MKRLFPYCDQTGYIIEEGSALRLFENVIEMVGRSPKKFDLIEFLVIWGLNGERFKSELQWGL